MIVCRRTRVASLSSALAFLALQSPSVDWPELDVRTAPHRTRPTYLCDCCCLSVRCYCSLRHTPYAHMFYAIRHTPYGLRSFDPRSLDLP